MSSSALCAGSTSFKSSCCNALHPSVGHRAPWASRKRTPCYQSRAATDHSGYTTFRPPGKRQFAATGWQKRECRGDHWQPSWFWHITYTIFGRKLRQHGSLGITNRQSFPTHALIKIARKINEIRNRHRAIVIHIPHLPGRPADVIEIGGQVNEIRDGDDPIKIQVA